MSSSVTPLNNEMWFINNSLTWTAAVAHHLHLSVTLDMQTNGATVFTPSIDLYSCRPRLKSRGSRFGVVMNLNNFPIKLCGAGECFQRGFVIHHHLGPSPPAIAGHRATSRRLKGFQFLHTFITFFSSRHRRGLDTRQSITSIIHCLLSFFGISRTR